MRKKTVGNSTKWLDEYEWYLKFGERSGGRNLRLTKHLFQKGYFDPSNTIRGKIDSFIRRTWIHGANVELERSEVIRRHKLSTVIMFGLFGLALMFRVM